MILKQVKSAFQIDLFNGIKLNKLSIKHLAWLSFLAVDYLCNY